MVSRSFCVGYFMRGVGLGFCRSFEGKEGKVFRVKRCRVIREEVVNGGSL